MANCSVETCPDVAVARGWCSGHWERWRRYGTVQAEIPKRRRSRSAHERFWDLVDRRGADECWPWRGVPGAGGYPRFAISYGVTVSAHRHMYELMVGPIPAGLQVDHLCRNRLCVNPAHLEPVTARENQRRADAVLGIRSAVTHCPKGHLYDEANTYINTHGGRVCRKCGRTAVHRYLQRKKTAQQEATPPP